MSHERARSYFLIYTKADVHVDCSVEVVRVNSVTPGANYLTTEVSCTLLGNGGSLTAQRKLFVHPFGASPKQWAEASRRTEAVFRGSENELHKEWVALYDSRYHRGCVIEGCNRAGQISFCLSCSIPFHEDCRKGSKFCSDDCYNRVCTENVKTVNVANVRAGELLAFLPEQNWDKPSLAQVIEVVDNSIKARLVLEEDEVVEEQHWFARIADLPPKQFFDLYYLGVNDAKSGSPKFLPSLKDWEEILCREAKEHCYCFNHNKPQHKDLACEICYRYVCDPCSKTQFAADEQVRPRIGAKEGLKTHELCLDCYKKFIDRERTFWVTENTLRRKFRKDYEDFQSNAVPVKRNSSQKKKSASASQVTRKPSAGKWHQAAASASNAAEPKRKSSSHSSMQPEKRSTRKRSNGAIGKEEGAAEKRVGSDDDKDEGPSSVRERRSREKRAMAQSEKQSANPVRGSAKNQVEVEQPPQGEVSSPPVRDEEEEPRSSRRKGSSSRQSVAAPKSPRATRKRDQASAAPEGENEVEPVRDDDEQEIQGRKSRKGSASSVSQRRLNATDGDQVDQLVGDDNSHNNSGGGADNDALSQSPPERQSPKKKKGKGSRSKRNRSDDEPEDRRGKGEKKKSAVVQGQQQPDRDEEQDWTLIASAHGKLDEGNKGFVKTSGRPWKCATRGTIGWNSGVHTWTVLLRKRAAKTSVGISRENISTIDAVVNAPFRYDVYGGNGGAVDPSDDNHDCFGLALNDGDQVMIRLDLDQRSVTFGQNNKWNPRPTFTNLLDGKWYPYFAFQENGASVLVTEMN